MEENIPTHFLLQPKIIIVILISFLLGSLSTYVAVTSLANQSSAINPTLSQYPSPIVTISPTPEIPTPTNFTCPPDYAKVCQAGNCECQLMTNSEDSNKNKSCQTTADCYPGPTCNPALIEMYGNTSHCPVPMCDKGVCYWNSVP